ncbi:hypothetical protein GCT13_13345 [Paraburkholderia sp. CNPSo 3157]|uniref:Uncharacterized protein n=1 Tax=Paraburkholderia franconis TaxID=2654983 RepID=A0A7X1TFY6_9BURK|nr:hypothetical protein [Paraburkholderia franconis]MPW17895.1 hypothetical protein [Paraburkholderia franconis]
MSEIKIHETNTNTTTHRAVLDGEAMKEILGAHVAQLAGVDVNASHVHISVHLSSRMGSYNTIEEGIVTVTVDHRAALRADES